MSVYFYSSFLTTFVNFKSKSSFMHTNFTFDWLIDLSSIDMPLIYCVLSLDVNICLARKGALKHAG